MVETAQIIRKARDSAIIYVPTRNRTDGVTAVLRWWNVSAHPYHAGLPGAERRSLLERFVDGRINIMVATNAFGMGIDKPNVRHVIHLGVPTRPEAYYQEAGRAGRDGNKACCHLFWRDADLNLAKRLAGIARGSDAGDRQLAVRKAGLRTMTQYVTTRRCRRRLLLRYLGEELEQCAGCDRCGQSRNQPNG